MNKPRIFLSYAREDNELVKQLYQALTDIGFDPWMDVEKLLPGEQWDLAIERAIRNSDFFVACISTRSVNKRGVIQKEIKKALDIWQEKIDSDIYLIPARLEDCQVPPMLERIQWVDLFRENGFERLQKAVHEGMRRRGNYLPRVDQLEQRIERVRYSDVSASEPAAFIHNIPGWFWVAIGVTGLGVACIIGGMIVSLTSPSVSPTATSTTATRIAEATRSFASTVPVVMPTLNATPTRTAMPSATPTSTVTRAPTWTPTPTVSIIRSENVGRIELLKKFDFPGWIEWVVFSPNSEFLATAGEKGIWVTDLRFGGQKYMKGHTAQVHSLAFSPDALRLYSGGVDVGGGKVRVWDWISEKELWSVAISPEGWGVQVAISPNGKWFSTNGASTVTLWRPNINGLDEPRKLGCGGWTTFSSDNKRVACGSTTGIHLFSLEKNESLLIPFTEKPDLLAFTPDGKMIATTTANAVRVANTSDGTIIKSFNVFLTQGFLRGVAISADSTVLAAGAANEVKLWDLQTGREFSLKGHSNNIQSVAFSPDGTLLASGANDGTVRLWGLR